ncbi:DUF1828 domain-containing protein [Enterococcus columbae]|uniref:DUF1828 domain-containing protein n=1 Tax=Enterococcus columbae DSM 7374 = ATCC 51263 TaxID=1121865 RepID=S1MU34_9ENTE|nr:DUF1828 domain-containing protein [Enterococcus columbae]EOT40556.1 hypothetical protein OMW_01418 [Enterococcus columbae DSM 7374 = ATCC 51263]EOW80332.1 hypothetical protein I568_02032 [Enterococcus columbae DSM 7374 = ATCC 51263]OJG25510.1 hypothetical protein RR47_GL001559 [Enterococcus columbae DSM 7374 = ATCC 51263]
MPTYLTDLQKIYYEWMTQKIKFTAKENIVIINTPFVDNLNDNIQLVVEKIENDYIISDDGYTLDELELTNPSIIKFGKRKHWFNQILFNFGVKLNEETRELYIRFHDLNDFPLIQTRLIQCTIQVADLFYTTRDKVINLFSEEVANFFLEMDLPITQNILFRGKSGADVHFDVAIGKTKYRNQCAIKIVNNPISNAYKLPLLSIIDTKALRTDTDFLVIANDENKLSDKFKAVFKNYEIPILLWSNRRNWIEHFKMNKRNTPSSQ